MAAHIADYFRCGHAKEDEMTTLVDIAAHLKEPFALDDIDFLPKGKIERDGKTFCMALPYADPRVYQDRLNAIAYGEWSTPPPVVIAAGNKLICYVTVVLCGVPHTDVGEATNNEENTGTEAWSQAFKRACSHFGLGRYLYDLEKEWVPFNPQKKLIDLDAAGKRVIVRKMYQKAGIIEKASEKPATPPVSRGTSNHPTPSTQTPRVVPGEIEKLLSEVKQSLYTHYQFSAADQAPKWKTFKVHVLGVPVEDEGLSIDELKRLRDAVKQKIANAKGGA